MTYIEFASLLFATGAGAAVIAAVTCLFPDESADRMRSFIMAFVVACVLGGIALWSWRLAEGIEAADGALKILQ